jgi:hypothetical protein
MKNDSNKQEAERTKVKPDDLLSRVDSLPALDSCPEDEILGYDERGIPESSESNRTVELRVPGAGSDAKWPDFALGPRRFSAIAFCREPIWSSRNAVDIES